MAWWGRELGRNGWVSRRAEGVGCGASRVAWPYPLVNERASASFESDSGSEEDSNLAGGGIFCSKVPAGRIVRVHDQSSFKTVPMPRFLVHNELRLLLNRSR